MKGFIYKLKCPETNEIRYIGQTISKLSNRLKNHIYETKRNIRLKKNLTHKENWIQTLIKKELENSIIIELIEECEIDKIDEREIFWINTYKNEKLTNIDSGGKRTILTDETKEKISIANSGERNGMFGKRFKISSEEIDKRRTAMIASEKFQSSRKSKEFSDKISKVQKVDDWLLLNENKEVIGIFNNSKEVSDFLKCTRSNVKNARRDNRMLLKKYWITYKKDYEQIL
jgi:group I intron endonuclease